MTLFNIGTRIDLTDFTEAEAAPLAWGLLGVQAFRHSGVQANDDQRSTVVPQASTSDGLNTRTPERLNAERLLKRILYWTGGHPYLTQRLCRAVAEAGGTSPAAVDRVCEEIFLAKSAQTRDDNLLFVRDRLLRSEADLAGLLELYGRVRSGQPVA